MVGEGFVRSGYIHMQYGPFWHKSARGFYWPRSAGGYSSYVGDNAATAYRLYFDASGVSPSNGPEDRWAGFPLRCLAL